MRLIDAVRCYQSVYVMHGIAHKCDSGYVHMAYLLVQVLLVVVVCKNDLQGQQACDVAHRLPL